MFITSATDLNQSYRKYCPTMERHLKTTQTQVQTSKRRKGTLTVSIVVAKVPHHFDFHVLSHSLKGFIDRIIFAHCNRPQ